MHRVPLRSLLLLLLLYVLPLQLWWPWRQGGRGSSSDLCCAYANSEVNIV
jgi:hypothetical protein